MPTGNNTMTSRERVLAALDHREPDRVPIDLGGNQTGIHKVAYRALVEHLGLVEEIEIMDAVQQLARPSEAVLERLRVDIYRALIRFTVPTPMRRAQLRLIEIYVTSCSAWKRRRFPPSFNTFELTR
jgi:hypothetical protein